MLKNILAAIAATNSTDFSAPSYQDVPKAQQRGGITYYPRSILSRPGTARAYYPGRHPEGTRVQMRSRGYVVGRGGNLIRA